MKILLGVLAVCFVIAAIFTSMEGGFVLLFGWIAFLGRVVPRMSADWPSVWVGVGAVALFACCVHAVGYSWRTRPTSSEIAASRQWKFRWTISIVIVVLVLFTAGISIIGIIHQMSWLLRSEESLYGESLPGQVRNPIHNLKMIGMAMQGQHDMRKKFPVGGSFTADGAMLHSWETQIIWSFPYTTGEIDMTKPWNDPVNQKYFKCILPEFINPGFRTVELEDSEGYGLSHYAANSHVLSGNKTMGLGDIKDGAANTLLIGEVNGHFKPWGHPVNWRDPIAGINRSSRGFGGPPGQGGANFAMADGSVRFVSERISPEVLRR